MSSGWTSVAGGGPPWSSAVSRRLSLPPTEMLPFMPASAWPGIEQMNVTPPSGTSTTALADSPAWAEMIVPSGKVMSWTIEPVLVSRTSYLPGVSTLEIGRLETEVDRGDLEGAEDLPAGGGRRAGDSDRRWRRGGRVARMVRG